MLGLHTRWHLKLSANSHNHIHYTLTVPCAFSVTLVHAVQRSSAVRVLPHNQCHECFQGAAEAETYLKVKDNQ